MTRASALVVGFFGGLETWRWSGLSDGFACQFSPANLVACPAVTPQSSHVDAKRSKLVLSVSIEGQPCEDPTVRTCSIGPEIDSIDA
jgi:hypothetical protein